jgi:hypothetical protein
MTTAIIAAAAYAASIFLQWWGGFISIETPRRRRRESAHRHLDRQSSLVWDVAFAIEVVGLILGWLGVGRMPTETRFVGVVGLVVLGLGGALRWVAILTLGRLFTGVVAIQDGLGLLTPSMMAGALGPIGPATRPRGCGPARRPRAFSVERRSAWRPRDARKTRRSRSRRRAHE